MSGEKSEHNWIVVVTLEFWPEYNCGPLWTSDGQSVDLASLHIPASLRERLAQWNANYGDEKLPFEANNSVWLAEGKALLAELRAHLGGAYSVVVTEPWWGEEPDP